MCTREPPHRIALMATPQVELTIDEYLRKRLMPVEGAIPQLVGIDMYGNSIPAGPVGGDLFEYINFQQRYNIDARVARALTLSKEYLEPFLTGQTPRNSVDAHVEWLQSKPGYSDSVAAEYKRAKRSEQLRIAEDPSGTPHDRRSSTGGRSGARHYLGEDCLNCPRHLPCIHAFGAGSERKNNTRHVREDQSAARPSHVTARNALGWDKDDNSREIATMLYGEIRPSGHFRFVNFGHPPPLVFSAEYEKFVEIGKARMVQFLPLGLAIPEDNPDRNRYLSMTPRTRKMNSSDVAEITLMSPGDILFLYTDGVYDGSDEQDRVAD